MANETIFIGIDENRIELFGDELKAFISQQKKDQVETNAIQAEADAKAAARASALAKLAALGLTQEEIDAL